MFIGKPLEQFESRCRLIKSPLISSLEAAQAGNSDELLALVDRFKPLLSKYANLLKYDDAYHDMRLEFIDWVVCFHAERLRKLPEEILLAYLKKSMRNAYIKLSRRASAYRKLHILFSEMSEAEQFHAENDASKCDEYIGLEHSYLYGVLSPNEADILILRYYCGFSFEEIARCKQVSRMTVNRWKNKALEKLRENMDAV